MNLKLAFFYTIIGSITAQKVARLMKNMCKE